MAKTLISKRDIGINLYLLDNGNGLLEATMLDASHLIKLEMEVHPDTRTIVSASSELVIHPYPLCKMVEDRAKNLAGLKIEKGVMKKVGLAVGTSSGCVHLRELAMETINFAATALVGVEKGFALMDPGYNRKDPATRHALSSSLLKNTCKSYTLPYDEHEKELEKHYKKD